MRKKECSLLRQLGTNNGDEEEGEQRNGSLRGKERVGVRLTMVDWNRRKKSAGWWLQGPGPQGEVAVKVNVT